MPLRPSSTASVLVTMAAAGLADLFRDLLHHLRAARRQHHVGALLRELERDIAAHARPEARHDRDLALQQPGSRHARAPFSSGATSAPNAAIWSTDSSTE